MVAHWRLLQQDLIFALNDLARSDFLISHPAHFFCPETNRTDSLKSVMIQSADFSLLLFNTKTGWATDLRALCTSQKRIIMQVPCTLWCDSFPFLCETLGISRGLFRGKIPSAPMFCPLLVWPRFCQRFNKLLVLSETSAKKSPRVWWTKRFFWWKN